MSIRIVFKKDAKEFNNITKAAHKVLLATHEKHSDTFAPLSLNQFRELSARLFGYNSKNDIEKSATSSSQDSLINLANVDVDTFLNLIERMILLTDNDPLFTKEPYRHFSKQKNSDDIRLLWSIFADALLGEITKYQPSREFYILVPIISTTRSHAYERVDINKIADILSDTCNIQVTSLPTYTRTCNIDLNDVDGYEYSDNMAPINPFHTEKQSNFQDNENCSYSIPLQKTEIWFHFTLKANYEILQELEKLSGLAIRQYRSESDDFDECELVAIYPPYVIDQRDLKRNDDKPLFYYQEGNNFTFSALNNFCRNPSFTKTIPIFHLSQHIGYIVANNKKQKVFTSSIDKIGYESHSDDWDDVMVHGPTSIGSFLSTEIETSYYDTNDLDCFCDDSNVLLEDSELTTDGTYSPWPDFSDALDKDISRIGSHFNGAVISMPRTDLTIPHFHDSTDDDSSDYYDAIHRTEATATFVIEKANPHAPLFMLEQQGEHYKAHGAGQLILTKIIQHCDGVVGFIVAELYSRDGRMLIASESFTIIHPFISNKEDDKLSSKYCPLVARLRDLANQHDWHFSEVECEYEWYTTNIDDITTFGGLPPQKAALANIRGVSLTVLTQNVRRPLTDLQHEQVTSILKDALLHYTPFRTHENGEIEPIINITINAQKETHFLLPLFHMGSDKLSSYTGDAGKAFAADSKTGGRPNQLTQHPIPGPIGLFFLMEGSVTDLDEINVSLGSMNVAGMFTGKKTDRIPNEIDSDNFPNEYAALSCILNLDKTKDKLIIEIHKN